MALFGGTLRFQSSLPPADATSLQFYNDQGTTQIRGIVASDPEVGVKTTQFTLSATGIMAGNEWREVSGKARLLVPRYPAYSYGDVLLASGKLETPAQLGDFDYQGYLAQQGIYSAVTYPRIEVVATGKGFKPLGAVYSIRNRLSQALAMVLPEPQASLAQGIVLGIRGMIPQSLNTNFSRSGTAHLLAISGVNLSILAGMLLSLGVWLFGRRHHIHIWLALAVVWIYALITGSNAPVIRAAIMVTMFLTAELLGRQRSAIVALTFAAAIMVGISPHVLRQASFQMSFAAMAGLVFVFPHLQELGRKAAVAALGDEGTRVSLANAAVGSFGVALAALIAVWPLVSYYFGIVSLVGPIATFVASPSLPAIIVTGVLAAGIAPFALPIAQVIAWLAWIFLSYLILVVNVFAQLPLSFLKIELTNTGLIWGYYLLLAIALWLSTHRQQAGRLVGFLSRLRPSASQTGNLATRMPAKWIIPPLLAVAILVSITAVTMPDDRLHVSFLDVGEGDAILVQRGSQQVLIDGGPSPQAINLALGRRMPFWDRTIEMVILTHPHQDHLTGLVEVLRRYHVEQVLYSETNYQSTIYDEWLTLTSGISPTAKVGQEIDLGNGVRIEVLNPQSPPLTKTESDIDNNSLVLRLSLGKVSFLFTADIFHEAELELAYRRADLNSTVLKVAHHGSDTSTTPQFLGVVSPQLAVVSSSADNPFGHPNNAVIARLNEKLGATNIYRTDQHGTIEFVTEGDRLWVRVEKP